MMEFPCVIMVQGFITFNLESDTENQKSYGCKMGGIIFEEISSVQQYVNI